jgi:hypothetical protein
MINISRIFLFILALVQLACNARSAFKSENGNPTELVVVTNNKTQNPILLAMDESYRNAGNSRKVIHKMNDTLNINVSRLEYYYISHKNSYPDTVLAGPGDTIKLFAGSNEIRIEVLSKTGKNKVVQDYFMQLSKTVLGRKCDSLMRLFYRTNGDTNRIFDT